MLTLFLDFASSDHLLALVSGEKIDAVCHLKNQTDDSELMPEIEQLLTEGNVSIKDLTHIAAVTGPGGFMSLRVGISLANALSWSLKIPVAGVHGSDLWHWRAISGQRSAISESPVNRLSLTAYRLLWLHSTKKNLLFLRGFGDLVSKWPEPIAMPIDDAARQIPEGTTFIGELIEEHRKALPQVTPHPSVKPLADVLPEFLSGLNFAMKPLLPWYGREG